MLLVLTVPAVVRRGFIRALVPQDVLERALPRDFVTEVRVIGTGDVVPISRIFRFRLAVPVLRIHVLRMLVGPVSHRIIGLVPDERRIGRVQAR